MKQNLHVLLPENAENKVKHSRSEYRSQDQAFDEYQLQIRMCFCVWQRIN